MENNIEITDRYLCKIFLNMNLYFNNKISDFEIFKDHGFTPINDSDFSFRWKIFRRNIFVCHMIFVLISKNGQSTNKVFYEAVDIKSTNELMVFVKLMG